MIRKGDDPEGRGIRGRRRFRASKNRVDRVSVGGGDFEHRGTPVEGDASEGRGILGGIRLRASQRRQSGHASVWAGLLIRVVSSSTRLPSFNMRNRALTLSGDRALALTATGLRLRGGFGRDRGAESDDTDDDIGLTINARELRQHKLEFGKYRRAGEHEGGPLDHMFVGMQDEKVHRRERGIRGRSEKRNPR